MGPGGVNAMMGGAGDFMNQITSSPLATSKLAESFSVLDAIGLNYGESRYELDRRQSPNRIFIGTETFRAGCGFTSAISGRNPS